MSNAFWFGPAVAGVLFGILYGAIVLVASRWTKAPARSLVMHMLGGAVAGAVFFAFLLLDKLIDAGALGPTWPWLTPGVRVVAGVFVIGALLKLTSHLAYRLRA